MPQSGTTDPKDGQVTTRVPSRLKTATIDWAHNQNGENPYIEISQATIVRDSLYLYYLAMWSELPDEITSELDPQYLADQVQTVPADYLRRLSSVDAQIEVSA